MPLSEEYEALRSEYEELRELKKRIADLDNANKKPSSRTLSYIYDGLKRCGRNFWKWLNEEPRRPEKKEFDLSDMSEGTAWIVCSGIGLGLSLLAYGLWVFFLTWGSTIAVIATFILSIGAFLGVLLLIVLGGNTRYGVWPVLVVGVLVAGLANSDSKPGNGSQSLGKPSDMPQEQWDYVNNRLSAELPNENQRDIDSATRAIWEYEKKRNAREN